MNKKNIRWLCFVTLLAALTGCENHSDRYDDPGTAAGAATQTGPIRFLVKNVDGEPIQGAVVTLAAASGRFHSTTDSFGVAEFVDGPTGAVKVSISEAGYETQTFDRSLLVRSYDYSVTLEAVGAWAGGRAIVLGTRMIARASDGSDLVFSVDVAVINEQSEAIQTLTSADFAVDIIDCGWGGPRDCASDRDGNATAGNWHTAGPAVDFALQPPRARQPYRARVLVVRNQVDAYWSSLLPALKVFFAEVGGNDSVSLSSVQLEHGGTTHTVLGPFTSDGPTYFDAIDALPLPPAPGELEILPSLIESLTDVAGVGAEPSVVVLGGPWLEVEDIHVATAHARELGVHISALSLWTSYGVPEMTPRTGGFVADVTDWLQLPIVLGALDRLLAGELPFYRMEFRLVGERGTFVAGGNAKVWMRVDVPSPLPTRAQYAVADVAIE